MRHSFFMLSYFQQHKRCGRVNGIDVVAEDVVRGVALAGLQFSAAVPEAE
jgi:hypothetical protein